MKNILFVGVLTIGIQTTASGAEQGQSSWNIVERSAHNRTWQRMETEMEPNGETIPQLHRYEEIATGLCYKDETSGEWKDSQAEISILPNGAGATAAQGSHKVIFPPDIFDGLIELSTPDSKWLKSRVLGLAYLDSDGRSVLIAETKSSVGVLHGNNVVVYPDAFDGVLASIRYTYTISSFEQDVVIEAQLPSPQAYGLSDNVKVQVLTEFVDAPTPVKITREENGLRDEQLNFGVMAIGRGTAFALGDEQNRDQGEPVGKSWESMVDGENGGVQRTFLVEEVGYQRIEPKLRELLPRTAMNRKPASPNSALYKLASKRLLPAPRLAKQGTNTFQLAKADVLSKPGYVLDYVTLNSSQTNCTWAGDGTFYMSGNVSLWGTNTIFEAGCVLKFASNVTLTVNTPVTWLGSSYRPVVMTSKNDNSVGEAISGSTGTPTNYFAVTALNFDATTANTNLVLQNLRVANAQTAVAINGRSGHVLSHVQLVTCQKGLSLTTTEASLRNALFDHVLTNFTGSSATCRVEHLTSDTAIWLNKDIGSYLYLTNCLLAGVTNLGNYTTLQNVSSASSGSGVFQTVGAGYHYLSDGSTNRNTGTTNISASLLVDLRKLTTYPPILYSNVTNSSLETFSPQAQRDTDIQDIGYHYDPLDYLSAGYTMNNSASLMLTNGVAVGLYGSTGFLLNSATNFVYSTGRPEAMNRIAWYPAVQEQPVKLNNHTPTSAALFSMANGAPPSAQKFIQLRFTDLPMQGYRQKFFTVAYPYLSLQVTLQDSWLRGVDLTSISLPQSATYSWTPSVTLQNNLLERCTVSLFNGYLNFGGPPNWDNPLNVTLYNNLFWRSTLSLTYMDSLASYHPAWTIRDNLFDTNSISFSGDGSYQAQVTRSNNGFYRTTTNALSGTTNLIMSSLVYGKGPLGPWYISLSSASVANAGSRTADLAALYHYTEATNTTGGLLIKETNSVVDIGFHYVATDSSGSPIDTDGDGWPDYWEDSNGNGSVDSGEFDWQSYNSQNGFSGAAALQVFTPLK